MNNILPILIILLAAGAALMSLLQLRGSMTMTVMEGETKNSEYRAQMVNKYITIVVYWLGTMLLDDKPMVYQSDDCEITYIDFGTQYGLLSIAVNWSRNRARLHFALHDLPSGSYSDTVMTVRADTDGGFVKFCKKVEAIHCDLINSEKEALTALTDLAAKHQRNPNEDLSDEMVALYFLATQALSQQKNINPYSISAYIRLASIIHTHYADKVAEVVQQYSESKTKID